MSTAATLKLAATASAVGIVWIHACGSWTPATSSGGGTVGVASSSSTPGINTPAQCPAGQVGNGLDVIGLGKTTAGKRASWQINAAPGFSIVGAHTVGNQGMVTYGVDSGMGWGGGFYWQGGGAQVSQGEGNYSSPAINSPYFGWQVVCGWSTCDGSTKPGEIGVLEIEIEGAETSGPTVSVAPGSLGSASGWVRGSWPIAFSADGPSGACQLAASLGGASVSQPLNEPQSQTTWHQCSAGSFSQSFNTAAVGSASGVPLVMWARDAAYDYQAGAYLATAVTNNVNIDNTPVSLSLSGPTDAPSTAGVQYVSATATAGPSGVQGISCSVDGAPAQSYSGASAQVPVSGIGSHSIRCAADNNAVDASGGHGVVELGNLDLEHPTADGEWHRILEAGRQNALPPTPRADPRAGAVGDGASASQVGPGEDARAHQARHRHALPPAHRASKDLRVGDGEAPGQDGACSAREAHTGSCDAAPRDTHLKARGARQGDRREWMARHAERDRARRPDRPCARRT